MNLLKAECTPGKGDLKPNLKEGTMAKVKSDTVKYSMKKQTDFTAKEVPGAARKAVNKQIGDTAIRAPKSKSDKHQD